MKTEQKTEMLYAAACGVVECLLETPPSFDDVQRSKEVVKNTVSFMLADHKVFGCLLKAISSDYHIYSHSVNVVTYSIALAQRLGFTDAATLRELGMGAMVHDVGKSKVDPEILTSPEALTHGQWEIMKQHPQFGYDMLAATGSMGEIALDIVLHHHEKMNGAGYPDGLNAGRLSPLVRIVSIADVFDALTTDRCFQKSRTSFKALSMMNLLTNNELDRDLFKTFVSMMGRPFD